MLALVMSLPQKVSPGALNVALNIVPIAAAVRSTHCRRNAAFTRSCGEFPPLSFVPLFVVKNVTARRFRVLFAEVATPRVVVFVGSVCLRWGVRGLLCERLCGRMFDVRLSLRNRRRDGIFGRSKRRTGAVSGQSSDHDRRHL